MKDIALAPKIQNVLILDYDTLRLQSKGFIKLMVDEEIEGADEMLPLDSSETLLKILNHQSRNMTDFFSDDVSEHDYYNYIRNNFSKVSNASESTNLSLTCSIMSNQSFVINTYVGTYEPMPLNSFTTNNFKPLVFDIFDISKIEDVIISNDIVSLFISDVSMVMDIVLNFRIKLEGFSFIISKIGYNFITDENDELVNIYEKELEELSKEFDFKYVFVDLYNSIDPDSIVPDDIDKEYDEFDILNIKQERI